MTVANLKLKSAEEARKKITTAQQKRIKKMYEELAKKTAEQAKLLEGKDNISSVLRIQYLNKLEKQLKNEVQRISSELKSEIKKGMTDISVSVTESNKEWLKNAGLEIKGVWSRVPTDIVNRIETGQVYDSKWSLSKRIWGIENKTMKDIHSVIAQGVASNKSAYEIAKDLEKYVSPSAKKDWAWNKVYPGTNKRIDYNAQRLARTLTQHAYQQSFIETTKSNPFIEKYRWESSNSARMCELCAQRNGQLFNKDELPLDHPNGLCSWTAVITKDWKQINKEIADWYKAPKGTYPELDDFAKSM